MTQDQFTILLILAATVAMFLWGKWRHDMIALAALLACVVTGLISQAQAFSGFGHPAVITVACVLVLSRGLQTSGAVDALTSKMLPAKAGIMPSMLALVSLGALLSCFMNNVGAMALLMPVGMQVASRLQLKPGQVLMPLAFGTILGGMTTLIGTPPNLIVSGFRVQSGSESFAMFDFTPVGLVVALVGIAFIILLGWRWVPARQQSGVEGFDSGAYITEARVLEDSKIVGLTLREIETKLEDGDAQIIGLVLNEVRISAPNPRRKIRAGNILVIEAEAETLASVLSSLGLKLAESIKPESEESKADIESNEQQNNKTSDVITASSKAAQQINEIESEVSSNEKEGKEQMDAAERNIVDDKSSVVEEIVLMELVVLPSSELIGRSASDLLLRTRYGINLLALSREGMRSIGRLRTAKLKSGDMLLIQGSAEVILEFAADNSCVPLAQRDLRIPNKRKATIAALIMLFAVVGAAFGLLPASVSFAMGVLASMAFNTVPPRTVYQAIDWPVIVLLASLIPVATAMQSTGTADLLAKFLLEGVAQGHAIVALVLIMVVTMFLSDLMNNAATAAVMCPLALGTAAALGVSPDSFLMAVAIGASCAFLTPIGHQNNTMILGPGGFKFSDYWKMGLPLEVLVLVVSIPMLLWVWPL